MKEIIGKWTQREDQPYAGLWFEFAENGEFKAEYSDMAIVSGGTYTLSGDEIDMDQTKHSLGMIGKFAGRYEVQGDVLKLALADGSGKARPENLDGARIYLKVKK